jgi:hypothetical protein
MLLSPKALPTLLLSTLACGAQVVDAPSIRDQPPDRAAEIVTEIGCGYAERCGEVSITCADCEGEGDCGGCSAEIHPVDYDECAGVLGPELVDGFSCMSLTNEEEAAADACLAALVDWDCPDAARVEQWANGGGGQDPAARPEGCDVLEEVRFRCSDRD